MSMVTLVEMKSVINRVVMFALVVLASTVLSGTTIIDRITPARADYMTDYVVALVDSGDSFQSRVDAPNNDIGKIVSPHCG